MKAQATLGKPGPAVSAPESLREISAFLIGMGIALMALGAVAVGVALSSPLLATFATVLVFGILLLLGAILQVVTAIWARSWKGFFLHLLAGALYLIAGVLMIQDPLGAAVALTLLVAVCLLVGGALRVVLSVMERFDGWGWALLNGIVSLLLGAAIWRQWPLSGLWVIGLFVGIDMLLSGVSWMMLGLAVRSSPKEVLPT
jgi:uncharacterized membrane protein HdeD (DUF308 family)